MDIAVKVNPAEQKRLDAEFVKQNLVAALTAAYRYLGFIETEDVLDATFYSEQEKKSIAD